MESGARSPGGLPRSATLSEGEVLDSPGFVADEASPETSETAVPRPEAVSVSTVVPGENISETALTQPEVPAATVSVSAVATKCPRQYRIRNSKPMHSNSFRCSPRAGSSESELRGSCRSLGWLRCFGCDVERPGSRTNRGSLCSTMSRASCGFGGRFAFSKVLAQRCH